jgi:hypothetical protein
VTLIAVLRQVVPRDRTRQAGLGARHVPRHEQRCWNHKILNVLDTLPKKLQGEARALLCRIPDAPTRREAEALRQEFRSRYGRQHPAAVGTLERDWDRLVAFYGFPKEHWKHLRTTNPVESPFAAVRLRTAAGKRSKKVANATALIWRVLLVAERSFCRLDHPELLPEVAEGAAYVDGVRVLRDVNSATEGPRTHRVFAHLAPLVGLTLRGRRRPPPDWRSSREARCTLEPKLPGAAPSGRPGKRIC